MHTKDARLRGETEQRIYALNAWRETPFFTDRERAALEWTEAVTRVGDTHVPDDVYERVTAQFNEDGARGADVGGGGDQQLESDRRRLPRPGRELSAQNPGGEVAQLTQRTEERPLITEEAARLAGEGVCGGNVGISGHARAGIVRKRRGCRTRTAPARCCSRLRTAGSSRGARRRAAATSGSHRRAVLPRTRRALNGSIT